MIKNTKYLLKFFVLALVSIFVVTGILSRPAFAADGGDTVTCRSGFVPNENNDGCVEYDPEDPTMGNKINCPAGFRPSSNGEPNINGESCTRAGFEGNCEEEELNAENCSIVSYIVTAVRILSALVGIIVVLMITVGGIQYSSSRDNPQIAQAAKKRISNAILALVAYLFMFGLLDYLIPGGLF